MNNIKDDMDRKLVKKRGIRRKHILYILGGVLVLVTIWWMLFGNHSSKLNVDKKRLLIESVQQTQFNDYVRINGQVQPIHTIMLSAQEGGLVAEKVAEEGSLVNKGDVIVRLENSMLNLNILDSEAQLAEKQNFLRNTRVTMEQERLNLKRERLQLLLDVERKKRSYLQYSQLHKELLCSKEEYLQAKEDAKFAEESLQLIIERQKQDSIYRGIQIKQMEESLDNIHRNLELVRQRVGNLNIKAPVSGQLSLLDVELGQNVASGMRVGQVNVLSDYKVEAMIDEFYIDRVKQGLEATFERQKQSFNLRVRKVFPEVREKQFKAEFLFEGERPENIRTGQTYYLNLQLGEPVEAVVIPRGAFYQATGGRWIFVLTADGSRVVKRAITLGRQNPNFYEVVDGLKPGEQVIVSSYEEFGNVEELKLK